MSAAGDRLLHLVYRIQRLSWIARSSRSLLHFLLTRMSFVIPAHKLRETSTLVAFNHPQPAYTIHILLVPKRAIPSLAELDPARDAAFLTDLFATVQSLIKELHLNESGFRLLVNGGEYQDFPYLHFHLISGHGLQSQQYKPEDVCPFK